MRSTISIQNGDRFGNLTFTGNRQKEGAGRHQRWLGEFMCDCGNTKFIRLDCVIRGNNKSCGCKSPNRHYKEKRKAMGNDYPYHVLISLFRKNSKKRGIDFALSVDDVKAQYAKQHGRCVYTNEVIVMPGNFLRIFDKNVASIDRIDSQLGYTPDNIQLTTKTINMMKQTMSHNEFVGMCQLVVKYSCSDLVETRIFNTPSSPPPRSIVRSSGEYTGLSY